MTTLYMQPWEGYLGTGVQTAGIGTSVAATKFQKITSASIKVIQPNITKVSAIQKSRANTSFTFGMKSVAGQISGPLIPDEMFMGHFWAFLLGGNNAVSGTGITGYTHTFSESVGDQLPTFGATIEKFMGGVDATMMSDYVGCFFNDMTLTVPETGPVELSTSILGRSETLGDTVATPTFVNKSPFERHHCVLSLGANLASVSAVEFTSLTISYANNLQLKTNGGSRFPVAAQWGVPEISLSFGFDLKASQTILNYVRDNTELAAKIVLTHPTLAGSSSGFHELTVNLPRVLFTGDLPDLSSPDAQAIPVTLNGMCIKEIGTHNYAIQVVATNSEIGTYAVN